MPLFPLPTAIVVLSKSRLTPQLAGKTEQKLNEETDSQIVAAADFITGKILDAVGTAKWPFTNEQIELVQPSSIGTDEAGRQLRQATSATELEARARLWEDCGALDDEFDEESDRLRVLANREIASLTDSIKRIVRESPSTDPTPNNPRRPRRNRSRTRRIKPTL